MTKTARQLREGEVVPWYYGMAYWDPVTEVAMFYPVPLNLIVIGWLWLCFKLNGWRMKNHFNQHLRALIIEKASEANTRGYIQGYARGYEAGMAAAVRLIDKGIEGCA